MKKVVNKKTCEIGLENLSEDKIYTAKWNDHLLILKKASFQEDEYRWYCLTNLFQKGNYLSFNKKMTFGQLIESILSHKNKGDVFEFDNILQALEWVVEEMKEKSKQGFDLTIYNKSLYILKRDIFLAKFTL